MMVGIVVLIAALSLWSLARAVRRHPERVRLGDTTFVVGSDRRYGPLVDRQGPILFQDLVGSRRDVFLQHLGPKRWATFASVPPGADRSCQLKWVAETRVFEDRCVAGRTYPADGAGLTHFLTVLDAKGRIVVDLNKTVTGAPSLD